MQRNLANLPQLVADVGGTHIRIALSRAGAVEGVATWKCDDYRSLESAIRLYLKSEASGIEPPNAAVAVASPVTGDWIELTNQSWSFSRMQLREALGLDEVEVINDFAALALAIPELSSVDSRVLKEGVVEDSAPVAVLGPGTGLGVSALVPSADGGISVDTEGGHRDASASTQREWEVLQVLRRQFGRVSCERILSGPGLTNLYLALCHLGGAAPQDNEPQSIVERSKETENGIDREATELFSDWLGAFAGDLALTLGARGGIYLAGGVLPQMGASFSEERFLQRFLDKGRFRSYLEPIPVRLVLNTEAALMGAARYLETF